MTRDALYPPTRWHRLRWQLFWGLLAAALPPAIWIILFGFAGLDSLLNAAFGGLIATTVGILLIRNVTRYPGVERAAAIIPGFSASFGIAIVYFLMLRLDYSRLVLAGTYILAIVIFYIGYARVRGRRNLRVGVLTMPNEEPPRDLDGIEWRELTDPSDGIEGLEAIAVDLRNDLPRGWDRRIADFALAGIPVYHKKHLFESLSGRVELEHLSETSFGTLSPPTTYMIPKSIVDRLAAALALVLLSPLLVLVAVWIKVDSPGPAIFRQRRVGFRGETFVVYKFRTMRDEHVPGTNRRDAAITLENDDRITGPGRFLRRSRIDELPQIINILKGQMSWIGPRPEAEVLSSWYEQEIPFYRYRHVVRPGITGWAQVMQGHVAEVDQVRSKLYFDFYYIKNYSLWIDCLILFKTILTVISGFGAK